MILVDANILIYAKIAEMPNHEVARRWLDQSINGTSPVGLPWQSLLAFVRITTNHRVFPKPMSVSRAWAQVEEWLACPTVWTPTEGASHARLLATLMTDDLKFGDVPDANLAALAIENGLELCTADAGFARFVGLRWRNPLTKAGR